MKKIAILAVSVLLCVCAFVGCNGLKPIPKAPTIVMNTEAREFNSQFTLDFKLPTATCKSVVDGEDVEVVITAKKESGEDAVVENGYLKPQGIGKYNVYYNATDRGTFNVPAEEIVLTVNFEREIPEKPVITLDREEREISTPEGKRVELPVASCKSEIDGSDIRVEMNAVGPDGKEATLKGGILDAVLPGVYTVTYSAQEHEPLNTKCDDVVVKVNVVAYPVITLDTDKTQINTVVINNYKLPVANCVSAIDGEKLEVVVKVVDGLGKEVKVENGAIVTVNEGTYVVTYNAKDKGEFALDAKEVTVKITFAKDEGVKFTATENAENLLKADSFANYKVPTFDEIATVKHPFFGWVNGDFTVEANAVYTKNGTDKEEVVDVNAVNHYEAGVINVTYTLVPAADSAKSYTYQVKVNITDVNGLRADMFESREGRELPVVENGANGTVQFKNVPAWSGARTIKGTYLMNKFASIKANEGMKITVTNNGENSFKARFFLNDQVNVQSQTIQLHKGATGVVYFKNDNYYTLGKEVLEFWVDDNATLTVKVEFVNEEEVSYKVFDEANEGSLIATEMSKAGNSPKVTYQNGKFVVDALDGDKNINLLDLGRFSTAIRYFYTDLDYAKHMMQVIAVDVKMVETKISADDNNYQTVWFGTGVNVNSIKDAVSRNQKVNVGDTRTLYIPVGLLLSDGDLIDGNTQAPACQTNVDYGYLNINVTSSKVELSNFRVLNFANMEVSKEAFAETSEYNVFTIPEYDQLFVNSKSHTSNIEKIEFAKEENGSYTALPVASTVTGRVGFYKVTYNVENKDGTKDTAVLTIKSRVGFSSKDFVKSGSYNLPTMTDSVVNGKYTVTSSGFDFVSGGWPGATIPNEAGIMEKFFTLPQNEGMKITIKNVDKEKDFKGIFYMTADSNDNSQRPWLKPGEEAVMYFKNDGCYSKGVNGLSYWVDSEKCGAFSMTVEFVKDSDYEVTLLNNEKGAEIAEKMNGAATGGMSVAYANGEYTVTSTTGDEYLDLLALGNFSDKLKRYFANASARQRRLQVLAVDMELVSGANEMWFGVGYGANNVDCSRKQTISFNGNNKRTLYISIGMLGANGFWGGQGQQNNDAFTWVKLNLGNTVVKMSNMRVLNFAGIENIKSSQRETNEYENYVIPEYDAVFEDKNEHTSNIEKVEFAPTVDGVYQNIEIGTLTGRVGYYKVTYNVEYTNGEKDKAYLFVTSHQALRSAEFSKSEGYNLPTMVDSYENGKFYVTSSNYDFASGDYPGAKLTLDSAIMKKFLTLSQNEGMKITIKNVDTAKDFKAIFYMTSTGNTNNQVPWLKPGEEAVVYFKNDGCYDSAVTCLEYWVYAGFDGAFKMNIEFVKDSDYEVMAFDNANGDDICAKLNETKTGSVSVTYADGVYTATSTGGDDYLDFLALGAHSDLLKKYYATATPAQRMKQVFAIDLEYVSGANTVWMGLGIGKNNVDRSRAQTIKFGSNNKRTLYIPIGMLGVDPSTWNGQGQQRTENFDYVKLNLAGTVVKFSNVRILNFATDTNVAYDNVSVNQTYTVDYDKLFLDHTAHTTSVEKVEFAGANGVYNDLPVDSVLTDRNGTYKVTINVTNTATSVVTTKYVYVTAGFDTGKVYDANGLKNTKADANGKNYVTIGEGSEWNTVHFYDEALINEFNNGSSDTVLIIEGKNTSTSRIYMYVGNLTSVGGNGKQDGIYRMYVATGERFALVLSRTYSKIGGDIALSVAGFAGGELIIDDVRVENRSGSTRSVDVLTADEQTLANLNNDNGNIAYDVTKNAQNGGFDFTASSASDCYLNIWAEQYTQAKNAFNSEMPVNTQYKVISFDITNTSGNDGVMWMYYGYNGMNALDWMTTFYSVNVKNGETKTITVTYSMLDLQRMDGAGSLVPNYYKPCVSGMTSFTISNFKIYDFSKVA